MKRLFCFAAVGCLLMISSLACQEPADGPEYSSAFKAALQSPFFRQAAEPTLRLADESASGIGLQARVGGFRVGAHSTHGRLFSTLDCPACGWTNELGKPRLPVVRRFVEVPYGVAISLDVNTAAERAASLHELGALHDIFPVQGPVEKLPGAAERVPFEFDEETYSKDALYPSEQASVSGPYVIRGRRLFMVEYYPCRYNPARRELSIASRAMLRLNYSGASRAAPDRAGQRRFSPAFDSWFRNKVVNYHPPLKLRDISTDKYAEGFLFVVGNSYAANAGLLDYIETRRAEGHYVAMVPMSDIGSTAAALRTYIRGEYLSWSEPTLSYVVLVGDVDDVPVYDGSGGGHSQVTDLYYASIDPDDYSSDLLAPDLMVSRISVNNSSELSTYLDRANSYLYADFPTDEDWLTRLSFLASCDHDYVSEETHNYVIDNYTAGLGYTGTYPNDPQAGGDKLYCGQGGISEQVIQDALDDGRLVINFSGHGSETSWGDPSFSQTYLNGVQPPDAAPFVISNACITGTFGRAGGDCWGEMWLAHSHGSIVFWGASNSSYWEEDDILEKRLWDGIFVDGITRLADIVRNAKLETLANYGEVGTMEYYFEMYNSLGDATIDMYTDAPFDAIASYPAAVPVGIGQLDFSVSAGAEALQGALVCVRGGVVQQTGYTDSSGQVQLVLNPVPDNVGELQVTITAHNMRRHEGIIQVISPEGPYLVHSDHEVTSDGTTPVAPTPGLHIVMPVTLHNIGSDPATGIDATISSASSDVTITQNQLTYDDIAADALGRSTTHAEFDIHPDADDGSVANFALDWSADGGYADTTNFSVTIQRPLLVYVSHAVDDSAGGCDQDGIADANEPTVFEVTVENQGSADASQVAVDLTAPDCNDNGPVQIGSVLSGQQGLATITVTPQQSAPCPAEDVLFEVQATANELPTADVSSFSETINADIAIGSFEDDMEGIEPNGWTHGADQGTDDWGYVSDDSHSPTHSWFSADVDSVKDAYLMTPEIAIGDVAQLSFWQHYVLEDGYYSAYDGGVLEISTDGGNNYTDLGSYITMNGYNNSVSEYSSNPLAGREVWSGEMDWHEVIVDLSSFGPGTVIIRFRLGCDSSMAEQGWWIDDVVLDAETVICQQQACDPANQAPVAVAGVDQSVDSGDFVTLDGSGSYDPDDDAIDFDWNQTGGPGVSLADPHSVGPTFTAPDVEGEVDLVFELTVSDGLLDDSDSVIVTVWGGCDDGNACTDDSYNGTSCVHTPIECNDDKPCTSNECDPDSGCFYPDLADCILCGADGVCMGGVCQPGAQGTNLACDDGDACTRVDTCQGGSCVGGDPVVCTALDDCHVAGECDPGTGLCSDPPAADGTACDDSNACTQTDTCQSGECVGSDPVVCEALDACHVAGECNPDTGSCSNPPAEDGTACDDGNLCTGESSCQAGVCTGFDEVVCTALDQCHAAGECDPDTGLCSDPPAADGTACDDGNPCTVGDICQAAVCTAGDPLECTPLDSCHEAGVCDPDTGECSNPVKADGSACDDDDACTQTDTCLEGICQGSDPVVCEALDECHVAGVCNPLTGECSNLPKADGTPCDDGNACTTEDTCQAGVCTGGDAVECAAQDACHEAGECDPETGECTNPQSPDGTPCPGGECQAGECVEQGTGCGCSHGRPAAGSGLLLAALLGLLAIVPRKRRR